jgi:hypothetical protein
MVADRRHAFVRISVLRPEVKGATKPGRQIRGALAPPQNDCQLLWKPVTILDEFVGRTPWSAADPPVGFSGIASG